MQKEIHLTPIRMATTKKPECKGWCKNKATVGYSMEVPQNIRKRVTIRSSNSPLGTHPEELKGRISELCAHVYSSIIQNS